MDRPSPTAAMTTSHANRSHSLCSASGAERWLNCPGSVKLSMDLPYEPPSPAAQQGTRAHEMAEGLLKMWKDGSTLEVLESLRPGCDLIVSEMFDHAMTYVRRCIAEVEAFDHSSESPAGFRIEQRLTFNEDMRMFGTADFIATGLKDGVPCGVIVDLKYGKKRVKVEDNPQLAYYAVALKKASKKNLQSIKVIVVQPRLPSAEVSEVEYDIEALREWNKRLTLGAEKALLQIMSRQPQLTTGPWCWFCPARNVCPTRTQERVSSMFDD